MSRGDRAASKPWLEINIAPTAEGLQITAHGSEGQRPHPHTLGSLEAVLQFGEWVKEAALRGGALDQVVPRAQELHKALFQEGLLTVLDQLQGRQQAAKQEGKSTEPLLLRLMPQSKQLQAIPWEAFCQPMTQVGFLGTSQVMHLVRGVYSNEPWQPRDVTGAVRLLVISPSDENAPGLLRAALHQSIEAGEIEWLEPLTGPRTRLEFVNNRLRSEPVPHILHFIGHGGINAAGAPVLRLADTWDGKESWYTVEMLATELKNAFGRNLRLVLLEACEGAQPGMLSSAAEWLASAGADAVVAHLWPVKADVARRCSGTFYRSLTRATARRGDVASSLRDARHDVLSAHPNSAEAFSPVLYLRGPDSALFDFKDRKPQPPRASVQAAPPVSAEDPSVRALLDLVQQPFSLLLGDHWSTTQKEFHQALRDKLEGTPWAASEDLPLSALAQRYALHFTDERLRAQFQTMFRAAIPSMPLVTALARRLGPGLHINLMRVPVLENALAAHPPTLPLYVIQPAREEDAPPFIFRHEPGQGWKQLDALSGEGREIDPEHAVVLMRLYRGFLPLGDFHDPLLTEDDYLLAVHDLESVLPPTLVDSLKGTLESRPALLLGMSLLTWDHRMLLHRLFGYQSLPRRSTVLLEPESAETEAWLKGRSLPRGTRLQVVRASSEDLAALIDKASVGAGS